MKKEEVARLGKINRRKVRKLAKLIGRVTKFDKKIHDELEKILRPKNLQFELRHDFMSPYSTFNPNTLLIYDLCDQDNLQVRIKMNGSVVLEKENDS